MNDKIIVLAVAAILAASVAGITPAGINDPAQGEGGLVQSPLSLGGGATPAFIMAVDDSGSMTFQTQLAGSDGAACWSNTAKSFFSGSGSNTTLRSSGSGDLCQNFYVLPGNRIDQRHGIPPIDSLGFARSPDWNPSYFNPDVTYAPWVKADKSSYADASLTATRVHPDQNATVNLFTDTINTTYDYRVRDGMYLPNGTRYRVGRNEYKSNGGTWNNGSDDIYFGGQLATVYLKANKTLSGYTNLGRADDACGSGCDLYKYQPNTTATKQNFANWFSFYGNRQRAMIAGLTRSMKDVTKLKVGYFTINSGGSDNDDYKNVTMRDMDVGTDKIELYKQLLALPASGGTPNRYAVEHIGKQFQRTDAAAPIQTSCQKNAGMLFTDGFSNTGGPTVGGQDEGIGDPFQDTHNSTLADIAYKYYKTTLRTDTGYPAGKVPVPGACATATDKRRLDCQSNLHMNFYGITLGAKGNLFGNATYGSDGSAATEKAMTVTPAWLARSDNDASTVDEIWHATMSTRGKFINATTPASITNAMTSVLAAVAAYAGQSGSAAISGARVGSNSLSLSPSFSVDGTDWSGTLTASSMSLDPDTGELKPTLKWEASNELPAHAERNIYFAKTTAGTVTPALSEFRATNVAELLDLCAGYAAGSTCTTRIASLATKAEAVDYLRGDSSNAGTGKKLRGRTSALGDIINSAPIVAAPRDNYGYTSLLGTGEDLDENDPYDYGDYLTTKSTLGTAVYVGANDGMLHAFDGADGKEKFAYIPATAVGLMGGLLFPEVQDFQHRYFVDGQLTVSDARYADAWHTVLVGASGSGGRSVFALDVTTPNDSGAPTVLWEINDQLGGTTGQRIGHVLGKPLIVPVRAKDGTTAWKAIFGNGYGSTASAGGASYLFVVDIGSGAVSTVEAKEASGGLTRPNGLGNLVALDRKHIAGGVISSGSDGFVDTIYGGDLHGNVWRFDLEDDGSFQVGVDGKPLFTAKDADGKRQPITGGLEAALGPKGGVMVLFGTGSFMFEKTANNNDKTNDDMQSAYGVLDIGTGTTTLLRGNLQAQTLTESTGAVSSNDVAYYGTRSGWYLDLNSKVKNSAGVSVAAGERMVGRPRLEGGTFLFPTFSPSSTDPCAGGGTNALYGLKALSGGGDLGSFRKGPTGDPAAAGTGKMALVTDGSSPVMDIGILNSPRSDGLVPITGETEAEFNARLAKNLGAARCDVIVQAPGATPLYRWRACGRQSWRQVR